MTNSSILNIQYLRMKNFKIILQIPKDHYIAFVTSLIFGNLSAFFSRTLESLLDPLKKETRLQA